MKVHIPSENFWNDKRVLITGHTGFKGGWLTLWLKSLGADLLGISLPPEKKPNFFDLVSLQNGMDSEFEDLRFNRKILNLTKSFEPEIVFHLAAQPLVRKSYDEPLETFSTNVMGTLNLFEAIRETKNVKAVVNVTTDKVYRNNEWIWGYREMDPIGGKDPYSSSKACVELITDCYRASFFKENSCRIATARSGNVLGGGDWSADRLIPDILAIKNSNKKFKIRNPNSIRPWQHVLEPIYGYLLLAENLYNDGKKFEEGWNFGPAPENQKTVMEVFQLTCKFLGVPVNWELLTTVLKPEAQFLALDSTKARQELGWYQTWSVSEAIEAVLDWHNQFELGNNLEDVSLEQISHFTKRIETKTQLYDV